MCLSSCKESIGSENSFSGKHSLHVEPQTVMLGVLFLELTMHYLLV